MVTGWSGCDCFCLLLYTVMNVDFKGMAKCNFNISTLKEI